MTAVDSETHIRKNFEDSVAEGTFCMDPGSMYLSWQETASKLERTHPLCFSELEIFHGDQAIPDRPVSYTFQTEDNTNLINALRHSPSGGNMLQPLLEWIDDHRGRGCRTALVCATDSQVGRLTSVLSSYDLSIERVERFPEPMPGRRYDDRSILIMTGRLSAGFCWL